MRVSEEQRRALYDLLREHLDERTATLLMEVTVPANVELATRGDIQELRGEVLLRIAELEERLGARFAGLEDRFAGLEERFAGLEGRFAGLENRFAGLEDRFAGVEQRIAGVEQRIAGLEDRFAGVEQRIAGLGTMLLDRIYKVVIPTLVGTTVLIVTLATFVSGLIG